MTIAIQLDFLDLEKHKTPATKLDITLIEKDFRILDKKCQNVQKGLFARFSTIQEEVEILRDLCHKIKIELEELKQGSPQRAEVIPFINQSN